MKAEMTRQNDEQQIMEVIESQLAALSAKELEGSVSAYAEENVMYTMAPPLRSQNGASNVREAVEGWFDTWDGPIKYETADLNITVSGDLAYSTGFHRMVGDQSGEHIDTWFRKTQVFQRTEGEWKIVHDHESVPFYMDGSFKAATDLKP